MLEVAYWIGPNPGVWDPQIDQQYALPRYRDARPVARRGSDNRNRWVVFHFHFDSTLAQAHQLPLQGGHAYTGFVSVTLVLVCTGGKDCSY